MGLFKNIKKKVQTKTKLVKTKVKGRIESVKEKMQKNIKKLGFNVLLPYKPLMVAILRKRGHNIPMSTNIKAVSALFYDAVIKGKSHFDYNSYAWLNTPYQHLDENEAKIVAAASTSIIPEILKWIKEIINKKMQGKQLSEEENLVAEADKQVESQGAVINEREGFFKRLFKALFPRMYSYDEREHFVRRRMVADVVTSSPRAWKRARAARVNNLATSLNNSIIARTPSVIAGAVEAPVNAPINAPVNASEMAAMLNMNSATMQHYKRANGMYATAYVNNTPLVSRLKPHSWHLDKYGKWHWVDAKGHYVS